MVVGAKVCELTEDLLCFVCGLYVGILTSSLIIALGGWPCGLGGNRLTACVGAVYGGPAPSGGWRRETSGQYPVVSVRMTIDNKYSYPQEQWFLYQGTYCKCCWAFDLMETWENRRAAQRFRGAVEQLFRRAFPTIWVVQGSRPRFWDERRRV